MGKTRRRGLDWARRVATGAKDAARSLGRTPNHAGKRREKGMGLSATCYYLLGAGAKTEEKERARKEGEGEKKLRRPLIDTAVLFLVRKSSRALKERKKERGQLAQT